MNRVHGFHRKRPHILPPLTNSQSSLPSPIDSLQPPDLILLGNRLGSPAPRPSDPRETEYVCNENIGKPTIKISAPQQKENNLMKFDLLSDSIFSKTKNLLNQKENAFHGPNLELGANLRENLLSDNHPRKAFGKLGGDLDLIKSQLNSPLEEHENLESSEMKFFQIPNRYTLLKPIGESMPEK